MIVSYLKVKIIIKLLVNYLRFLRSSLTQEFGLDGVPIRFYIRDATYKKEKKVLEKENKG